MTVTKSGNLAKIFEISRFQACCDSLLQYCWDEARAGCPIKEDKLGAEHHKAGRGSSLPDKEPGKQASKSGSGSGPVMVARINQAPSKSIVIR